MIIADELKALGSPEWLLLHVEKTVRGSFFLSDLLRPLVLRLGLQDEVLKRQRNKLIQQKQELDVRNRRIVNLTDEKLGWEATNHTRNEYIKELKDCVKTLSEFKLRTEQQEAFSRRFVTATCKAPIAEHAPGPMSMGCKVPEPEQPYVPFRNKTAWAIGDKVRIDEHLKGRVRHISCSPRSGVRTVGILTSSTREMETTHWLGRKRQGGDIEYLNQYTQAAR